MARPVNAATISLLDSSESCQLTSYLDSSGIPTIGWGDTGPDVKLGMTITRSEADARRSQKIATTAAFIEKHVRVRLSDNQFGALVDFAYNVGVGAFLGSTLLRLLNGGDYASVPAQLERWTKDKRGKVMGGLVIRRDKDVALWLTPDTHPNAIGVVASAGPKAPSFKAPAPVAHPPSLVERVRAWWHTEFGEAKAA